MLEHISKIVWGPALLILVLGTGIFLTLATGFFPIRKAGFIIKSTFGGILHNKKAFAAAATAIGATVGTGNIIGVASAITIGGPGAVFWMWVGAFFGMMLKFAEASLSVRFGDAAAYIQKAFAGKKPSIIWCICCVLASFGGGNMIQTNAAAKVFSDSFEISPVIIGAAIAVITCTVLFRGAKAVTKASSLLVPVMAAIYVLGCFAVLFIFRNNIFSALEEIFSSAFSFSAAGGGIGGFVFSKALRTGIAKGTFTHEAGMGSASIAHAESKETYPIKQGCWGIIEVFIDTIFVCTLTALVILSVPGGNSAESIFRNLFGFSGDVFICVSMFLFALAAVIGWAFYGEKALSYITKNKNAISIYRIVFCLAAVLGAVSKTPVIWNITDIFNGLMTFPNLSAIILLSPEIIKITKQKPSG